MMIFTGWTILKNRRSFGSLTMHRIEQRHQKPMVQEVPKPDQLERSGSRKLIEEVEPASQTAKLEQPMAEYSLVKTKAGSKVILARILLPAVDPDQLEVSVVADSGLTLRDSGGLQIVGVTLPHPVDPLGTRAIYNSRSKVMTVLLPVTKCTA